MSLLLACALATGLLVAAARPLPRTAAAALAGLVALLLGLDSAPEASGTRAQVIALAGVAVGAHLLLLNVVALTSYARRPWLKVGVRVLGSWSAASALLVLALAIALTAAHRAPLRSVGKWFCSAWPMRSRVSRR